MTLRRKKEAVGDVPVVSVSDTSDVTLSYDLVEKLAGHDSLDVASAQSLFVNQGSLDIHPSTIGDARLGHGLVRDCQNPARPVCPPKLHQPWRLPKLN